jgi:4-amino-4-deoxy-L-arabinose transferase-like glycosyltransferase
MRHLLDGTAKVREWLRDERHCRAVLGAVLVTAFVLRLAAALVVPLDYREGRDDRTVYTRLATHLLTLGKYGADPGVPDAMIPPGYPLLVAAVFSVAGQSLMAIRLVQVLLGTIAVWLVYLVGREAVPKPVSLFAALLAAVYPPWILYSVVPMTETLYTVLLLAFIWSLVRCLKAGSTKLAAIAGATFGLTLLTRETLYFFPLLLPAALCWSRVAWRRAARYLAAFAVFVLLTMSPLLMRNYLTFGQAFYSDRTAATWYQLTGSGYLAPRYAYLADGNAPSPTSAHLELFERYGRASDMMSLESLLTEPATYFRHVANRLVTYWLRPNGFNSLVRARPNALGVQAAYLAPHLLILALAGVELVAGIRQRELAPGIFLLLLAYSTAVILFFLTDPQSRYHLPFLSMVFILAVGGASRILRGSLSRKLFPS